MNLYRVSLISIVTCLVGLVVLLFVIVRGEQEMNLNQAVTAELLTLDKRTDAFSAASDSLLVLGADPDLWRVYLDEARDLELALETLGETYPDARRAAHQTRIITQTIESALALPGDESDAQIDGVEPIELPTRSRIILQQVANRGIGLDTSLDNALVERQREITREMRWRGAVLAASALIFGALCVVAFGLIHRRMALPARTLVATLERIRAGDTEARATVGGTDELSKLADTLNTLLDERLAIESHLRERQQRIERAMAELESTRDQLILAQAVGQIGSWYADLSSGHLESSDQVFEILGIAPEEFGHTEDAFFALVHPEDRDWLQQRRQEWLENGGELDLEHRIVCPNGEVRWVHERGLISQAENGRALAATGTVQDITDRRQQETRIRELQLLIEGGEDLCGIVDDTYRFVWVNQAYLERYQMSQEELEGMHMADLLGTEYFEREIKPHVDRCLTGETQRFEAERSFPELGRRILLVRYHPIDVPGVANRRVGAVITDITSNRETEAEVAAQASLLDIAGRAARFGGWSVDLRQGTCTWSNVTAEIHAMPHGYSPSVNEGIGFYAPGYRDRIRAMFSACIEQGQPYDEELEIIDASGQRRWVRTVGEPVYDNTSEIVEVRGAFQDITERKQLALDRQQISDRLAAMLKSITDGCVAFDEQWRYIYVNPEAERLLGKPADELLGASLHDQFPQLAGSPIEAALEQAMGAGRSSTVEQFFEPLGAWFEVRAYPWAEGIAVFFRDVTDHHVMLEKLRHQDAELRQSRDKLRTAFEMRQMLINSLPANIALLDTEGSILDVNDQWRHYGRRNDNPDTSFGVGRNYIAICEAANDDCAEDAMKVAQGLRSVLAGRSDRFEQEYPCHSPDRRQWFRVVFNRLAAGDGELSGAVAMHVDITERKLAELELERIAFEDPLTGALTRHGFDRTLQEHLEEQGWEQSAMVVTLDTIGLRDVNEAHGYNVGDRLLVALTERLRKRVGPRGHVARVAGDQFAAYLVPRSTERPEETLDAIVTELTHPFGLGGERIEVGIRCGGTTLGEHHRSVEELMREAELALFECLVDQASPSPWIVFAPELSNRARERIQLTQELRHALDSEEFELHFQPKVDLHDGRLIAAEALIRWHHPQRGLQPPGRFIPLAEQSQLIGPIGDWALRAACRHLREWQSEGLDLVRVSVNVSLVQFLLGDFPATVRRALHDFDVAPGALSLEITESVFERHTDQLLAEMRELHQLGVRLSLDDFGTGYSSLRYLQQYPFDEVKIDQAFTSHLLTDRFSRDIVRSVLNIAEAMGAETVAEGIECPEVAQALLEMGCRIGQGFHYSVPLEAEDFRWLLSTRNRLPLKVELEAGHDEES